MNDLNQIAKSLCENAVPSPDDGVSNVDRVRYIAQVFEVDEIDLTTVIPYEEVLTSDDTSIVEAAIHLLKLQNQFLSAAFYSGLIEPESHELKSAWFMLALNKLYWHRRHLHEGKPTPPFTFIH